MALFYLYKVFVLTKVVGFKQGLPVVAMVKGRARKQVKWISALKLSGG